MLRWFKTWIYNEDLALKKISQLFTDYNSAFNCLKEIQKHHVISGSSVMYGETQITSGDKISDVDIYVLSHHKYIEVVDVIKKYFPEVSYEIEHSALTNSKKSRILNVKTKYTVKIDNEVKTETDRVYFQIITTNCKSARDVIELADFDYVAAAIYKDTLYTGQYTRTSWDTCRIGYTNGKINTNRLEKILQKNYRTVLFQTDNSNEIYSNNFVEIKNLENLELEPVNLDNNKQSFYDMNFRIVDIMPTKNYAIDKYANCIEEAHFVLQNTNGNTISCDKLVVDITNMKDIIIPNNVMGESNVAWVRPIVAKKYPKSKVKYLVESFITDPLIIKNVLNFKLPSISIENSETDIVNCYLSLLENSDNLDKWNYFKKLYFTQNKSIPEIAQRLFQNKNLKIKSMRDLVLCVENLTV